MAKIEITIVDATEEELEVLRNGGDALRSLCRNEVGVFESVVQQHPHYPEGLSRFESFAVEGYLYQKIRGHVDETPDQSDNADRRQDVPS